MPELNLAFDLIRNERSTVPFGNRLRIDGRNAARIPTIRWFEVRNRSNVRFDSIGFDRIPSDCFTYEARGVLEISSPPSKYPIYRVVSKRSVRQDMRY